MVVAAPIATSVIPILRRRFCGIFVDNSRPAPKPNAARVATIRPKTGSLIVSFFIRTSCLRCRDCLAGTVPLCPEARLRFAPGLFEVVSVGLPGLTIAMIAHDGETFYFLPAKG